jgi:hypothetical protein
LLRLASFLVENNRHQEAVPLLRECVAIRQARHGDDDWRTAQAESLLGAALTRLQRFDEAETSLLSSSDVLKVDPGAPRGLMKRTVERLVHLYETWGKNARANRFRSSLTENTAVAE